MLTIPTKMVSVLYVDAENRVIYDCDASDWLLKEGPQADACGRSAQAFLQKLYDDMGSR